MSFISLNLIEPLQNAVAAKGYIEPTPIQKQAIPELLKGRDLIGIAQTGTGKTAAFVLPILQNMSLKGPSGILKTLVLAPTRELALQINDSFSEYGKFLRFRHTVVFGGVNQFRQVSALKKGVDILTATPGRLLDLAGQGYISLRDIEYFVLDEADRMLDMGFLPDIRKIIRLLPVKKQSLFFSATMSQEIDQLARTMLDNPVRVEAASQGTTVESVRQGVFFVDNSSREKLLLEVLRQRHLTSVLVFTRTRFKADRVAGFLTRNNVSAAAIHGSKSQNSRLRALRDFRSGHVRVLVATDIAARGIDIEDISHVINFELPDEPEVYVHRIGRTARAGAEGSAFSFCSAADSDTLIKIEKLIRLSLKVMEHPFHSAEAQCAVSRSASSSGSRKVSSRHFKPVGRRSLVR